MLPAVVAWVRRAVGGHALLSTWTLAGRVCARNVIQSVVLDKTLLVHTLGPAWDSADHLVASWAATVDVAVLTDVRNGLVVLSRVCLKVRARRAGRLLRKSERRTVQGQAGRVWVGQRLVQEAGLRSGTVPVAVRHTSSASAIKIGSRAVNARCKAEQSQ